MGKQQRNKQFESSVNELGKRTVADILLASVLLCCAGVFIFFFIKAPQGLKDVESYYKMTLVFGGADIVVAAALLFKIGFFRLFSTTAWTARFKGIERSRVLPTPMYVNAVKIFALMFALLNIIFLILVIRKVI